MILLGQLILVGAIGLLIGWQLKKEKIEAEIKAINSEVRKIMNATSRDINEARIERDGFLIQMETLIKMIKGFEKRETERIQKEYKEEESRIKNAQSPKIKRTEEKMSNLKK